MTRDEAIEKYERVLAHVPDAADPQDHHTHFVDALVALGLLKLEEPKSLEDNSDTMIKVWSFYDAPKELRELSRHGGDEDWLAIVPRKRAGEWIPWLESGGPFGVCDVSEHRMVNGSVVYIGAHA